jgi:hypothetical protein
VSVYKAKHRGEPEFRIFEPGDIVAFPGGRGHRFLVCVGGYMTIGDWVFCSSDKPMTSKDFALVGQATPAGCM